MQILGNVIGRISDSNFERKAGLLFEQIDVEGKVLY
jgi:hypothetical protein